jgi:hypothetical protein
MPIPNYTYKIINAADKTHGYDIYAERKLMITKTVFPDCLALKVLKPKLCRKVAQLVISKIKKVKCRLPFTTEK